MLLKRNKIILSTAVTIIVFAAVFLFIVYFTNGDNSAKEHVIVIPTGAFIPPEEWKPGTLVFNSRYFNPSNLTINVGDRVRWINRDSVTHTVTDIDEKEKFFDSILNPGEHYTLTFGREGEYVYMCTIHPWQGGLIKVARMQD